MTAYRLNDTAGAGSRAPKSKKSSAYGLNDAAGTRGPQKKRGGPRGKSRRLFFAAPLRREKWGRRRLARVNCSRLVPVHGRSTSHRASASWHPAAFGRMAPEPRGFHPRPPCSCRWRGCLVFFFLSVSVKAMFQGTWYRGVKLVSS